MTHEEAARILDPETTREALRPYLYDPERRLKVVEEACRVAAKVLRGKADRIDREVWTAKLLRIPDDDGCTWFQCSGCGFDFDSLADAPSFCPECGKAFNEKALAELEKRIGGAR